MIMFPRCEAHGRLPSNGESRARAASSATPILGKSSNSMFTSCKWHCAKAEGYFISFLLFRIADEEQAQLGEAGELLKPRNPYKPNSYAS